MEKTLIGINCFSPATPFTAWKRCGINWNGVNAVTILEWLRNLGLKPRGGAKTGHEFHRPRRSYIEMFSKMSLDKSLDYTVNDVLTGFMPSGGITIISDCMSKVGDSRTKARDRMTTL
jgi:hypothetical protein